jgi:hypothetical protein
MAIVAAGGIEVAVQAMRHCSVFPDVHDTASVLLANLASVPSVKERVSAAMRAGR